MRHERAADSRVLRVEFVTYFKPLPRNDCESTSRSSPCTLIEGIVRAWPHGSARHEPASTSGAQTLTFGSLDSVSMCAGMAVSRSTCAAAQSHNNHTSQRLRARESPTAHAAARHLVLEPADRRAVVQREAQHRRLGAHAHSQWRHLTRLCFTPSRHSGTTHAR
jgi:hypothetical protein